VSSIRVFHRALGGASHKTWILKGTPHFFFALTGRAQQKRRGKGVLYAKEIDVCAVDVFIGRIWGRCVIECKDKAALSVEWEGGYFF
jgi:hypothetical protein